MSDAENKGAGDGLWAEGLRELSEQGLRRELPSTLFFPVGPWTERRLVLCSNDYLALSRHPRVKGAAYKAIENGGCGSSGSRLLSGNSTYHMALEADLAGFTGYEACILFSSGYHANIGTIPAVASRLETIYSDERNHASIIDGSRLAQARTVTYRHCDPGHLDELLGSAGRGEKALVITEGVFSMDGDLAPLKDLVAVAKKHGALLLLDDAHGLGVLGPNGKGAREETGAMEGVDIYMATMGKALASSGGFVCGSRRLVYYLTSTARSLLYSTSPAPPACAAAMAALGVVKSKPRRREKLLELASHLRQFLRDAGLDTGSSTTHIIPVMAPGDGVAEELAKRLEERGYLTRAIRYPTVPRGSERLRLSLRCDFTTDQVRSLAEALAEEASAVGLIGSSGRGGESPAEGKTDE
jgi:8-amino-7-oxononanoate synthase